MQEAQNPGAPTRLPGVGERIELRDTNGRKVSVVRRKSGHVEIHTPGSGEPIELEPAVAASAGAFVAGHYLLPPEVAQRIDDVLEMLVIDWVRVRPGDAAAGRTIADLEVRRRTGVTIVAILRGSLSIVAPDPGARLEVGDDLVIACRERDRDRFAKFVTGGV